MQYRSLIIAAAASAVMCGFGGKATADEPLGTTGCVHRDTNGMVTLVICPSGVSMEEWRAAGEAACEERRPCGAWIWDDAALVPDTAPETHEALGAEAIAAAVAIWVAEDRSLITLQAVGD